MESESEVRARVREIIGELAPEKNPPDVENPRLLEDLAYHSLAMVELAFALEDEFALPPMDEDSVNENIRTVKDIEDYVLELLGEAATSTS
jgi:acyl carrier protein